MLMCLISVKTAANEHLQCILYSVYYKYNTRNKQHSTQHLWNVKSYAVMKKLDTRTIFKRGIPLLTKSTI